MGVDVDIFMGVDVDIFMGVDIDIFVEVTEKFLFRHGGL